MPGAASDRGPLTGLAVRVASWPAAHEAGRLLASLGADVRAVADGPALRAGDVVVDAPPAGPDEDWAASGAMALTGRPAGPPLHPTGRPATTARAAGLALELLGALGGARIEVDGARLLGERAAVRGLSRGGDVSAGGATRLLAARDGWFALSLARPDDLELVPALVGGPATGDAWATVARWAARHDAAEVEARAALLGLPVAALPREVPDRPAWTVSPAPAPGAGPGTAGDGPRPLVVDLGALWAAPLCAALLRRGGARVVDAESADRPDGARAGDPEFYALLHGGHELRRFDLARPAGRQQLRDLLADADVVIEASRPRALSALGLAADQVPATRPRTWVRITGHGRGEGAHRVAFGDDAAVAGGLVAWDERGPVFAGDAIADPLTGVHAAVAARAGLLSGRGWIIDVSMRDLAARSVAAGPTAAGSPPPGA